MPVRYVGERNQRTDGHKLEHSGNLIIQREQIIAIGNQWGARAGLIVLGMVQSNPYALTC